MTRLFLTTIGHTRTTPIHHAFGYRSCSWLVDPSEVDRDGSARDLPWWLRRFVTFRSSDHLGHPDRSWSDNIAAFLSRRGIDLAGGRVVALTSSRVLGHVFNPLTLYWCRDYAGRPVCVLAEVHNTYGQQHVYLLRPDDHHLATAEKALYVSPFNDMSGSYRMSLPEPADLLDVTVTLHRPGHRPFVATWRGHPVVTASDGLRAAARLPLSTWLVSAAIRWQGLRLWRRLPMTRQPDQTAQEDT